MAVDPRGHESPRTRLGPWIGPGDRRSFFAAHGGERVAMLFVRDYLDDPLIRRNDASPRDPLVSVILPTYRRFRCGMLERSVRSVLSQTFRDFELIVVDDGSSD